MYFAGNPFVEQVEAYRIWTISNCAKLVDFDGEKVTAAEKCSRIKDPPAVVKEAKSMEDHEEYLGKKVTIALRLPPAHVLLGAFHNKARAFADASSRARLHR